MILNKYFIPVILQQKPQQVVAKFTRKWILLVENAIYITFFSGAVGQELPSEGGYDHCRHNPPI